MKNTGIVKSIDNLGRILVPKTLRKELGIVYGDELEVYIHTENNQTFLCFLVPDSKEADMKLAQELLAKHNIQFPIESL